MTGSGSLAPDPESPIGLVLSGGGARGAFQVGVWKVLREEGMGANPSVISGTSSGAVNAALIAAGRTPDEMLEFWLGLGERPPFVANEAFFRSLLNAVFDLLLRELQRPLGARGRDVKALVRMLRTHRVTRSGGLLAGGLEYLFTARFDFLSELLDLVGTAYLFDTTPARERLRRALGTETLKADPRLKLAINAVDVRTGRPIRIVSAPPRKRSAAAASHYRVVEAITVDMVLASASIPLLCNPVNVRGELLWDGGLLVNTPLAPAVALGARRIIPVLATAGGRNTPAGVPTFGTAIERLFDAILENAYSVDRKLLLDRNAMACAPGDHGLQEVQLFRAVRPASNRTFNAGSYLFFEPTAMRQMYEEGVLAAREWLSAGPELDDRHRD
jgi:predicted acylesterase/phospholipase RssA